MIGVRGGRFEDIEENVHGVPERIEYSGGDSYNCKLEKQIHKKVYSSHHEAIRTMYLLKLNTNRV